MSFEKSEYDIFKFPNWNTNLDKVYYFFIV